MGIVLFLALVGYLFGCIHGSQLIGKLKGVDIKNSGVKNAGASNTTIVLGWKYGIMVAIIDIVKAIIPITLLRLFLDTILIDMAMFYTLLYLLGFFVIMGHIYPFSMKFNGGKGTASLVGMLIVIDWRIGLIGILVLVIGTWITDYLVIGVFFMYVSFIITTYWLDFGFNAIWISISLLLVSVLKHMENYKRIANKQEKKLSSMFSKKNS